MTEYAEARRKRSEAAKGPRVRSFYASERRPHTFGVAANPNPMEANGPGLPLGYLDGFQFPPSRFARNGHRHIAHPENCQPAFDSPWRASNGSKHRYLRGSCQPELDWWDHPDAHGEELEVTLDEDAD